jgi:hypothetical protein
LLPAVVSGIGTTSFFWWRQKSGERRKEQAERRGALASLSLELKVNIEILRGARTSTRRGSLSSVNYTQGKEAVRTLLQETQTALIRAFADVSRANQIIETQLRDPASIYHLLLLEHQFAKLRVDVDQAAGNAEHHDLSDEAFVEFTCLVEPLPEAVAANVWVVCKRLLDGSYPIAAVVPLDDILYECHVTSELRILFALPGETIVVLDIVLLSDVADGASAEIPAEVAERAHARYREWAVPNLRDSNLHSSISESV